MPDAENESYAASVVSSSRTREPGRASEKGLSYVKLTLPNAPGSRTRPLTGASGHQELVWMTANAMTQSER